MKQENILDGVENAVQFINITKKFGSVIANSNVTFNILKGEILSLLGENGSGKTTLMNMLSGIYFPDEGEILINGEKAVISSPIDAFKYKIGMVHQHFKLIDVFTALQNIALGLDKEIKFNILFRYSVFGSKLRTTRSRTYATCSVVDNNGSIALGNKLKVMLNACKVFGREM